MKKYENSVIEINKLRIKLKHKLKNSLRLWKQYINMIITERKSSIYLSHKCKQDNKKNID